jgi:DNA-directed RNA polymerase subunit RPC12/RpoP
LFKQAIVSNTSNAFSFAVDWFVGEALVLQISKQPKGDVQAFKLMGSVDEWVDFATHLGNPTSGRFELIMKEVTRFNSQGIRNWIRYMSGLVAKGILVRLVECSPGTVEAMNHVQSLTQGMQVDSVYVPYYCSQCEKELLGLFKVSDIKKLNFKVPDLSCPGCGGGAIFDDLPQEYFHFIQRKGSP